MKRVGSRNTQRKNKRKKEEICEDWCFACKDGGDVRICDYKDCLKVYHPKCVEKDHSFLKSKDRWTCNWHFCFICRKAAKFHCICCPKAVCGRCLWDAEFALVKGAEGFCNHCLKLAILIEENLDVDSDGGRVDFKDRNTIEFLFQGYWEIIKEKQGLSSDDVHNAKNLLKNEGYRYDFDSNEFGETEESVSRSDEESDYDNSKGREECIPVGKRKRSKGKLCATKRKVKAKKLEFIGWGSKSLLEFLSSIGTDTTKELSQYEVTSIVANYCKEKNLFDSKKRKTVICDAMLQSLLEKKSMNVNRIYNLLTAHFADNLELTEDDETGSSSEDEHMNFMVTCERQSKLISDRQPQKRKEVPEVQKNFFASLIAKNIKLVYLKRSVVEDLLKQPETFDEKVVGSFVRVKSDPNDYSPKNSHQLLQVKGIKKSSGCNGINTEIFLQCFNMPKDVPVRKLSNDDFCEEECEDLQQRVKDGLLKKPFVVELEQKARRLHEDITKHWIARELSLLQKRIDQANEKGRRRELDQYLDKKLLLETPSEQSRLLNEVPEVIADIENIELAPENSSPENLPKALRDSQKEIFNQPSKEPIPLPESSPRQQKGRESRQKAKTVPISSDGHGVGNPLRNLSVCHDKLPEAIGGSSQNPSAGLADGSLCYPKSGTDPADIAKFGSTPKNSLSQDKEEHDGSAESAFKGSSQTPITDLANETLCYPNDRTDPAEVQGGGIRRREHCRLVHVKNKSCKVLFSTQGQPGVTPQKPDHFSWEIFGGRPSEVKDVYHKVKIQRTSKAEIIELSDDDEDVKGQVIVPAPKDSGSDLWHCMGPLGEGRGTFKMSVLKKWNDTSDCKLKFKVWRKGQSKEEAIFLTDAIRQHYLKLEGTVVERERGTLSLIKLVVMNLAYIP